MANVKVKLGQLPPSAGFTHVEWNDTQLLSNAANTNYGSNTTFRVYHSATIDMRSILKVNFLPYLNENISTSSDIVSAALRLRISSSSNPGSHTVRLHYLPFPWDEATATYNIARTGTAWPTAGIVGVYRETVEDRQVFDDSTNDVNIHKKLDCTQLVKDIYDDVIPSAGGFAIVMDEDATTRSLYFWSNEAFSVGTDFQPWLEIEHVSAAGAATYNDYPSAGILLTESASAYLEFDLSGSDQFEMSDNTDGSGWEQTYTPYDGFYIGDNNTGSGVEFTKPASSGIILSETIVGVNTISGGAIDGIELSDDSSQTYDNYDSISDGLDLTESSTASAQFNPSASDSIKISDTSTFIQTVVESINDGIDFSDSNTAVVYFYPSASDGLTISEVLTNIMSMTNSASDGFEFSDVSNTALFESVSDSFTFSSSAGSHLIIIAEQVEDIFITTDVGVITGPLSAAAFDSLDFSDTTTDLIVTDDVASEVFLLSDSPTGSIVTFQPSATDGIELTDTPTEIYNYVNVIADGLTFATSAGIDYTQVLRAIDAIVMSDALSVSGTFCHSASDQIVFEDTLGSTFSGSALTITSNQLILTFVGRREK